MSAFSDAQEFLGVAIGLEVADVAGVIATVATVAAASE